MKILDPKDIDRIIDEAITVLEKTGLRIDNSEALERLKENGAHVDESDRHASFPTKLVEQSLKTAPAKIQLYDRDGALYTMLGDGRIHFNPGSSALTMLDWDTQRQRQPAAADLINFSLLTQSLENISLQSTALISGDVPEEISDSYRLYITLKYCKKPIVTGTFSACGFDVMKELLLTFRTDPTELRDRPFAIFDCCPSSPLKWSDFTCQNLMDCARSGIPAEVVSMPMTGVTAPGNLAGTLVQHTAENLSAVVIHQLTRSGAPIIWGGSPAAVDMRFGTTPMGAIETMMLDAANAAIGKILKLPTHAYMALSDAKRLDTQAGLETGMGAIIATLSGIDVISGPGMLDFERCQSLEKLVIDNDICGMALRLKSGIEITDKGLGADLCGDIYDGDHFLTSETTLNAMRNEYFSPSPTVDRRNYELWLAEDGRTAGDRAHDIVHDLLEKCEVPLPDEHKINEMRNIMRREAGKYGMTSLPREIENHG